jgi:DNA polymerase
MQNDLFDTAYNAILAADVYDDFASRLRAYDCRRCSLCHGRTNIVVDRGSAAAPVMLIGERAGDHEDLQGKPFVGRAGELLDKMLRAIELDPERDVFITNVTKCLRRWIAPRSRTRSTRACRFSRSRWRW